MADPVTQTQEPVQQGAQQPPQVDGPGADSAGGGATGSGAAGNSAFARALEDGGYFLDIGPGLTISPDELSARVNLEGMRQVLPGVRLRELRYNQRRRTATVVGDVTVPHLRSPRRGISITVNNEGETSLTATLVSDLPIFKNKRLDVSLDEQKNLAATLTIEPTDLTPRRGAGDLNVVGGGTFTLSGGKLSGNVEADLTYARLGSGHVSFSFTGEGRASGSGNFDFTTEFLQGASAQLEVDENANLKAEVSVPVSDINTPIQGLSVTEGTLTFSMDNSTPGGRMDNLKLVYNGFGEAVLNARIRNGEFSGNGRFNVTLQELANVNGRLNFRRGVLTGSVTIQARHFPRALQVRSGSITGTLQESGDIDFSGEAEVNLGPVGTGQLRASKQADLITIGATVMLENITGLQSGEFTVEFTNRGTIEGEGELATDDSLIPGLTGRVQVSFRENLWSGETEITYTREDPTVNGSVTVGVRQTEEGALAFYGNGELTAEVIPGVEGTAGVVIDEEGNVVLNFAFTQTEPFELFPERRQEREFVNIRRNIPLWAGIVVAVIRIRAGARAGVGPGQIRNSRIEGTWEVTSDEPPDLRVSSEFFMPAFVEGYVAFGAGLGVDVVLGSLTGGIEAMATAGLYGAVSVVPELSYENGDWLFDGTATLAAGARLKLSLNAWAEIEALWVTVWERTWELASHTMNIGPDLVLSANVAMNLSRPAPPEVTFESSDVDHAGLIDSAMPEDGPPGAGTREAMQNRAQWSGRTRQPGQDADRVPSDLAGQANQTEQAPAPPARPAPRQRPANPQEQGAEQTPQRNGGQPGAGQASPPTQNQRGASSQGSATNRRGANSRGQNRQQGPASPAGNTAPASGSRNNDPNTTRPAQADTPVQTAAPASQVPGSDQPRYPRAVTLETLNEPAATLPRTAAQQREDLNAAAKVLELAERQSQDAEQLATYFDRIRRRFQLNRVGYVREGEDVKVELSINPTLKPHPKTILMKGRGINGAATDVQFTTSTLPGSSDRVGIKMVASYLGPDHPGGSGPSGQDDLMGRLETTGNARTKFIQGHLLNDHVGGPGDAKNLFPITAKANNDHERLVENKVKTWVNQGYWMTYTVEVDYKRSKLTDSDITQNYVTANFKCSGAVLNLDNERSRSNKFSETIVSKKDINFDGDPRTTSRTVPAPGGAAPAVRPEDEAAEIELSRTAGGAQLDFALKTAMDGAIDRNSRRAVKTQLATVAGMSTVKLNVLMRAHLLSKTKRNIGHQLSTSEKTQLTILNGMSAALIAKLNTL